MLANGLPKIHSAWWLASCSDSSQALRPQESEAEREAAKVEGHHGHVLICLAFISERKHNRKLRLSKPGLHSLPAASIHPLLPRDKRAVQGAAGKIMTHHRCPRPQARTYNYVKLQGKDGLIVADYLTLKRGNGTFHSGAESTCQCRGNGFNPWSRKNPQACAPQLLKPMCSGARKPPTTKAHAPKACAQKQEKPPQRSLSLPVQQRVAPTATTRQSPHAATNTQHNQKIHR